MHADLSPLFQPLLVNGMLLANRFVMPAMQRGMVDNGGPNERLVEIFSRCAAGGVSLIIGEATAIDHPSAKVGAGTWIGRDSEASWRRCIQRVHAAGGKFFVQLAHPGAVRPDPDEPDHHPSLSPSGLFGEGLGHGRAMTLEDLRDVKESFVRSALIAQDLGADGVEIHSAHGYLLDQFLWSVTNRRTDGYGGASLAERGRFSAEIAAGIRGAVGPGFPISIRLSQFKEIDFTARIAETPDELRELIVLLRAAGVDLFHMSSRRFYQPAFANDPRSLAGWVKSWTDAAVISVGSVGLDNDVFSQFVNNAGDANSTVHGDLKQLAERFAADEFDLIAIGRSLIGDNDWVRKVGDGRADQIVPFRKTMLQPYLDSVEAETIQIRS